MALEGRAGEETMAANGSLRHTYGILRSPISDDFSGPEQDFLRYGVDGAVALLSVK